MLVHDEFMAHDASPQPFNETRPKSGVLTPASETSSLHDSQTLSRKRKRDNTENGNGLEDLLSERFTVKPHPSSVHDKPRTLKPIALLSRSDLSLSCLDRGRPSLSALPDSRLYECHVKILELENRMGSTPVVLIAQLDDKKSLYAVEYESRGLYVLFKLGSWIDLNKLCSVAVVSRYCQKPRTISGPQEAVLAGDAFVDTSNPRETDKFSNKKRLAIEAIQSMVKRPSVSFSSNNGQPVTPEPLAKTTTPDVIIEEPPVNNTVSVESLDVLAHPSAADILDNIRSQYLEALYLSKASTAYFAKGPLSRARAAFHLDYDSTLDMKDLIEFLDGLVLPTTTVDKKYKDGVPEFVSKLDPGNHSGDEGHGNAQSKKRKIKKVKLGKNGLYNIEDIFIRQWWGNHDVDVEIPGTTREISNRNRISQLRIRETQLQMILILETLALQKLASSSIDHADELPVSKPKGEITEDKAAMRAKAKKPRDLPALVTIHLDRLSIWQSLSVEEGNGVLKSVEGSKDPNTPFDNLTDKHAADILRGFCVEVIIPFFSARLPSICDSICRKLGGPRISSPARPSMKKSSSISNATLRPGAVTKRPLPAEDSRALQRVLADERAKSRSGSSGPSRAISLMRSATVPLIPSLKREVSESPSLTSIPSADSQAIYAANRAGVQSSKKFSQREVGLSFNTLIDPKSKKANIEAELMDAISALKRPNRQLAGQSMAELAEKRVIAAASQSKKFKRPVRNPLFESTRTSGVQILATPKGNRYKNMMNESQLPRLEVESELEPAFVPPSSISRIPSSGSRLGINLQSDRTSICKATPAKPRPGYGIPAATPTRTSTQSRLEYDLPTIRGTPSRASAQRSDLRDAYQIPVVTDTPARPPTSHLFDFANTMRKPVGNVEIPPSPSPPRARRRSTIDRFMNVSSDSRQENIFENSRKNTAIQATPVKKAAVREERRSPLRSLNLGSISTDSAIKGDILDIGNATTKDDDGDIYKSLGWDDDDL